MSEDVVGSLALCFFATIFAVAYFVGNGDPTAWLMVGVLLTPIAVSLWDKASSYFSKK